MKEWGQFEWCMAAIALTGGLITLFMISCIMIGLVHGIKEYYKKERGR